MRTPTLGYRPALLFVGAALVVGAAVGVSAGSGSTDSRSGAVQTTIGVRTQGTQGIVVSIPRGISCPDDCRASFRRGSELTLVAGSGRGSRLLRWGGSCVGSAAICLLVAEPNTSIMATFVRAEVGIGGALKTRYPVNVTVAGPGKVLSSPSGIACPPSAQCEKSFDKGRLVTLKAVPAKKGYEPRWTGLFADCRGDSCEVRVDTNVDVTASFRKIR